MTPSLRILKLWSKIGQPIKQNHYSSKHCEICGKYHGFCAFKYLYWDIQQNNYENYPQYQSDYECDGCKHFRENIEEYKTLIENDVYDDYSDFVIFEGQNPKIDCKNFIECQYCKGTGVYSNTVLEHLGQLCLEILEDANSEYEFVDINTAVEYYWYRNKPYDDGNWPLFLQHCAHTSYLYDTNNPNLFKCPFCNDTGKLEDPIEIVLVDTFMENLYTCSMFDKAAENLATLQLWKDMKDEKRYFESDFRKLSTL